jgi:uncharacterized protein (TIGR00269 family)
MQCSKCNQTAVFENRPSKLYFCKGHFLESVEKRVRIEIRNQIHFKKDGTVIGVAISGGKDSSVLLYLLWKTLHLRKNVTIKAFTVDEGIEGYRNAGLVSAKKLCQKLGVEHEIVSFKDNFSTEMDQVVKRNNLEGSPCAYCGPMRRDLMNKMSREFNADYVALGINLDDYAQSIMMNVLRGDFEKMLRLAPHKDTIEGLVPRVIPLRKVYEKEVKLYAILSEIEHDMGWCPYSLQAQRNKARDLINSLEEERPGTKLAIEGFLEKLQADYSNKEINKITDKCKICGEPSSEDVCQSCKRSQRS